MTIYDAGYTFVVVQGTLGVISCLVICFRVKILQNHRYADSETFFFFFFVGYIVCGSLRSRC